VILSRSMLLPQREIKICAAAHSAKNQIFARRAELLGLQFVANPRRGRTSSLHTATCPANCHPPPSGVGWCSIAAGRSPRLAPRHAASPSSGVEGEPAGHARPQQANPSPPPTSRASPTWAGVVRGGVGTSLGEPAVSRPLPPVCAADFSALYDRCMQSGLKARVSFNHAAGLQTVTLTCILPDPSTPAATTVKRRRHCRRRTRRDRAAAITAACDNQSRPQPSSPGTAAPSCENAQAKTPSPLPPEVAPPPAKRVRKRHNEAELLRESEDESELLLSPLSTQAAPVTPPPCTPPSSAPPAFSSPSPPSPDTCSEARFLETSVSTAPPTPPVLPLSPSLPAGSLPPQPSHHSSPAPAPSSPAPSEASVSEPTSSSIPVAPPMSSFFPSCPFKVICHLCFRDNHDIRYKQCPSCYKKQGGTNYFGW
jgi:hypothetical protein